MHNKKIIRRDYKTYLCFFVLHTACFSTQASTIIPEVNSIEKKPSLITSQNEAIQTSYITREQLAQSPLTNLTEVFAQTQSIVRLTNNSGDNSQTALSLRGFGDNAAANSLILVDGFPLTNPSLLAPNVNSIPLTDIERIEIFQGSEGTLWGDQAVGGVINIITRHPKTWVTNMIAGTGSFDNNYLNLFSSNKFTNGVFLKGFGAINSTANYRHHNRQTFDNLALQTGYDYSSGSLSLNVQAYENTVDLPGGLSPQQFYANPRQASNFLNYADYQTQLFQLLSKQILNEQWLLETRLSFHQTEGEGFVFANFNRQDELAILSPRLIGKFNKIKLVGGYDGQMSHYQLSQRQVDAHAKATQQSVYVQGIIPVYQTVDFTLGAREAAQDNTINNANQATINSTQRVFVSEQGLSFKPKENLSFFIRRDGNFSFPKANEQTLVANNVTSLDVQQGVSYEIGGQWLTERQRTQLNLYRLELQDEIAFSPIQTEQQPFGAFTNLDKTLRYGITLTQFQQLTKNVSFDAQFNYVDARFASGDQRGNLIPAVPSMLGNVNLNYLWQENWQLKYGLVYNGNRYPSDDVNNAGKEIPGYWLHEAAIQYKLSRALISFEVANLFNQLYSAYTYYNADTKQNTYYPGAGRSYLLTLKVDMT